MIEIIFSIMPVISMVIVWSYHYLKTKNMVYWCLVITANVIWAVYCIYCLFADPPNVLKSGLVTVLIDNVVSIAIAIYGIIRMRKMHKESVQNV